MKTTKQGNTTYHYFDSINEVVSYIHNNEMNSYTKEEREPNSINTTDYYKEFTKTESFEQAEDFLLHGWEYGTTQLKLKIGANKCDTRHINKPVYSVQGYQCSVPRYLQGLPENMIANKRVENKNKVLTIYKSCAYSSRIGSETIIEESAKVLNLINALEQNNYRVNLYIVIGSKGGRTISNTFVKIKSSNQKLNLKQVAFPLVHPSMLRRIWLRLAEIYKECSNSCFRYYGRPVQDKELLFNEQNKGQYFIPNIVSEKEITDINKYII